MSVIIATSTITISQPINAINIWFSAVQDVMKEYPWRIIQPRSDNFGITLFSRYPLQKQEIFFLEGADVPCIGAEIEVNGKTVIFLGVHFLPPIGKEWYCVRNKQLKNMAAVVGGRGAHPRRRF